jgi:hypothetical protein
MSRKVQHDIGFVAANLSSRLFRLLRAGAYKRIVPHIQNTAHKTGIVFMGLMLCSLRRFARSASA